MITDYEIRKAVADSINTKYDGELRVSLSMAASILSDAQEELNMNSLGPLNRGFDLIKTAMAVLQVSREYLDDARHISWAVVSGIIAEADLLLNTATLPEIVHDKIRVHVFINAAKRAIFQGTDILRERKS